MFEAFLDAQNYIDIGMCSGFGSYHNGPLPYINRYQVKYWHWV